MADDEPVEYHATIKDLPTGERPRERLVREGADKLSNAELLAILFRVGVEGENVLNLAGNLLAKFHGLAGLARASFTDLDEVNGLGQAKITTLKAAFELGKRLAIATPEDRPQIRSPQDAAQSFMSQMSFLDQEEMHVMLLDTRNRVLANDMIYKGNLNTSVVRISELFRTAIQHNAAAIIVAHNHPSGDPSPSPEDVAVTRSIIQAGKLLDIELLDHLVIGQQRYVSLKERGLAFE